jgi:8-oxo-dGTP pyrophosphatase MutT (NUDIX family)
MKDLIKKLLRENLLGEEYYDEDSTYTNDSGEYFFGNLGAGILPISSVTGRILLNYRSSSVNEPNTMGVWGGAVEESDDEGIKEAAKREFHEETGYVGSINLEKGYVYESDGGGFKYYNFIGVIGDEFKPKIDWESDGYKWVTLDELLNWNWSWDEDDVNNFGVKGRAPMHFGLSSLLSDAKSLSIIKRYAK